MEKLNVLVLGVGGNVSQGIIAALRKMKQEYRIVGACISKDSIGLYMCDAAYISPLANNSEFIKWIIEICEKEKIDIIFSGVEEIILELSKNIRYLEANTKAIFKSSPYEKLLIGNDKLETCKWLKENGLNYPEFAQGDKEREIEELIEKIGFPLIAKPKCGKGSQGIIILENRKDLKRIEKKEEYIIQEYLGNENEEYTIGCYCDKYGKMQSMIVMRRKLKYGTTFFAEIVKNKKIEKEAEKICKKFKPIGPLNIQLRLHKEVPVCFELNVRFSGTTPLRAQWGYNDIEAMIKEYLYHENINCLLKPQEKAKAYRYFNEIYIDIEMEKKLEKDGMVENVNKYDNLEEIRSRKK